MFDGCGGNHELLPRLKRKILDETNLPKKKKKRNGRSVTVRFSRDQIVLF